MPLKKPIGNYNLFELLYLCLYEIQEILAQNRSHEKNPLFLFFFNPLFLKKKKK